MSLDEVRFPLSPGDAVVWWMPVAVPPAAVVARWRTCLDGSEQARADRFHFAEDRNAYIAAHALTRALLVWAGGLPAADWRFVQGPSGKPHIDPALGRSRLEFSLSHTRGLVACAVSLDHPIGVDVEAIGRVDNELELAARFFAPAEVTLLRDAAPDQRPAVFARIWTLKEAYIKGTGEGLSCPLDSFSFTLEPLAVRFGAMPGDGWQFAQRELPGHMLGLALRCPAATPLVFTERRVGPHEL
jgi:4'-phosphopantetheinyl transferase